MLRVLVMIVIAALIWVPIGVYIGLRPTLAGKIEPIAQFLAAFPANIIFPFAVIFIAHYNLNPNIWLSPLMILGTQWYILFNVVAGTASFSKDLIYTSNMLNIKGLLWWRKVILPGIFPYLVTGAITAAGGSWNASIIAEVVSWGNVHYVAEGIGAYITKATTTNDFPRIIIGISIMSLYVIVLNNLIWHPLYNLAEKKSQLE
jgi:NitT/TauT family transport system permease protein